MAPSQLKQLKLSLRESGLVGPQQSKKKRRQQAKNGVSAQHRIQRQAALTDIRERFNPFEVKAPARGVKFDVTTRDSAGKTGGKGTIARPGVTKSLGEERRRETLLKDIRSKNKVGGIYDRRFGENDPTMTPEEKAAERFARESQKKLRKESMFNLEDEDEGFELTHGGQSIQFGQADDLEKDDFGSDELNGSDDELSDGDGSRKRKRHSISEMDQDSEEGSAEDEDQPERKKSKAEVMKEVIAKSKLYKYERQKAKEDDDDLRAELDKGLPDLFEMMRGIKPPAKPEPPKNDSLLMNPDRAALLEGKDRDQADTEYDRRLKQMTLEKRSQPTDRTKTDEEKAQEEAERLKSLEETRLRRMRGEDNGSDSEKETREPDDESDQDDAKAFGLAHPDEDLSGRHELGVEDEDDFIIDEDLVETDSNASLSFIQSDDDEISEQGTESEQSEADEELADHFSEADIPNEHITTDGGRENANLAYTYPCPETHEALLRILQNAEVADLPTVIQRIRALHNPRLHADNKAKLNKFLTVLVEHLVYLADQKEKPPFSVLENILRHIHSMAKSNPEGAAKAFRARLRDIATNRPLKLSTSDLITLTGISTIFPTSDHFHPVVTPANLTLTRYLGQKSIDNLSDLVKGAYAATLCINYQTLGKRYVPEFMNYCINALCHLSPSEIKESRGYFLQREPSKSFRLHTAKSLQYKKLRFWEVIETEPLDEKAEELKLSLVVTFVALLDSAAGLWSTKSAAYEIFEPAYKVVRRIMKLCTGIIPSALQDQIKVTVSKLGKLLSEARSSRRPLFLHDHRPLAIKTSIPKFEENFNPDKHYDPNRERAELAKLKAEHKRERKGAMRELRKDANFIARESLREKKERDAAYEKKYRRLIAEIQGEEGREAKVYEREKKLRQGKR